MRTVSQSNGKQTHNEFTIKSYQIKQYVLLPQHIVSIVTSVASARMSWFMPMVVATIVDRKRVVNHARGDERVLIAVGAARYTGEPHKE